MKTLLDFSVLFLKGVVVGSLLVSVSSGITWVAWETWRNHE